MRSENQQVYLTWASKLSRNLQSAHARLIHNSAGRGWNLRVDVEESTDLQRALILEPSPWPGGASSLMITRCLNAGERKAFFSSSHLHDA